MIAINHFVNFQILQTALGRQNICDPWIIGCGCVQCFGKTFEHCFCYMVIIPTCQNPDMKIHATGIGNGIEELFYHFRGHVTDPVCGKLCIPYKVRSSGQIDRTEHQGFIHRKDAASIALNPLFVTNCFF